MNINSQAFRCQGSSNDSHYILNINVKLELEQNCELPGPAASGPWILDMNINTIGIESANVMDYFYNVEFSFYANYYKNHFHWNYI